MLMRKSLVGLGALVLGAAIVAAQQQQATTQPAQARPRQSRRLVQPWSQINNLSDDVKSKIIDIHRKSVEERAAITAKERQDIMALLTDDQKKQVNDFEVQRSRSRAATTRPAAK